MTADTRAEAHNEIECGAFSRPTSLPGWMGKCDAPLKTLVPGSVQDDFRALARSLGMTDSDLLRELVMLRTYGPDRYARMQQDRIRMVAGIGTEPAQPLERAAS